MARPRKPYDQLAFQRPNSRHKGRQPTVLQERLHCGFCGRLSSEVEHLIQGDDGRRYSYICDQCVEDAVKVLATLEDETGDAQGDG